MDGEQKTSPVLRRRTGAQSVDSKAGQAFFVSEQVPAKHECDLGSAFGVRAAI